jgi:capsular polysaccharide biosynthesis protein
MEKTLSSKSFWILAVLVAAVIFAFGINGKQIYQTEIKILILPKSEIAARSLDQIVENAKEIPNSLSFYDKLIENNPAIDQGISALPDNERRSAWESKIEIRRIGKSGMISISAFNADQVQAEEVAAQVATDLQAVMGKYYDLDKNLSIRIIDGPITYLVSKTSLINWISISLLAGLIASLAIVSSINFSTKKIPNAKESVRAAISLKDLSRYDFRKAPKNQSQHKKASAPANLPIAEESRAPIIVEEKPENPMTEEKTHYREPTPDEVKERLNRLLRGN